MVIIIAIIVIVIKLIFILQFKIIIYCTKYMKWQLHQYMMIKYYIFEVTSSYQHLVSLNFQCAGFL